MKRNRSTAERCKEISQGYAFCAYPWYWENRYGAHPGRVGGILDTL